MKGVTLEAWNTLVWREDLPDPVPGPGEVVVKVSACALNRLDLWIVKGQRGPVAFPHVLGSDVCGIVEGSGRRVIVNPALAGGGILGLARWGGYAERVAVPEADCLHWPEGLAAPLAAAFPLVFITAHHMLHARGGLKAGETVLVLGGAGGVGSAAVQLAKAAGARVLAVVGGDDKAFRVRGLGADQVIVRSAEDFVQAAGPVDLVIDPVGGEVLAKALGALNPGGRLVTCAATAGPTATLELKSFFLRELSVLGSFMGSRADLEAALVLLAAGKVRPVVDTVFPMREAARAQGILEAGELFGKLVLVPE